MRRKNAAVTVRCDIPEGADADDVAEFITSALERWGGQLHPDDPLFSSLRVHSVTVSGQRFDNEDSDA